MISVAAPWVLGVGGIGALLTCVLHFLSVRRPPTLALPTMRFLPDKPVRAVSRSARPSDLWLLLMRVAALLLAGVGMAGVTWKDSRVNRARVVVIDRNGVLANTRSLREQTAAALQNGAVSAADRSLRATTIVVMDSVAHVLSASEARMFKTDTLTVTHSDATLSSALLASVRAAAAMIREESQIDSVSLLIVSPFPENSNDAALKSVRGLWPGSVSVSDVGADSVTSTTTRMQAKFVGPTPNAAVLSALPVGLVGASMTSPAAIAAAAQDTQSVSIEWPANGLPQGWSAQTMDTVGAIITHGQALVWPFVRVARVPDSLAHSARAIAWWSDGQVAAIERTVTGGCIRQVGIGVSPSSDALQGQAAHALVGALVSACGVTRSASRLSPAVREMLVGKGGAAPASAFRSDATLRTPFGSVMLFLALLLLSAEWWIRDRERVTLAKQSDASPLRKVA